MELKWTSKALSDLVWLHDFLAPPISHAAARVVQSLTAAPKRLVEYPRIGEKLEQHEPRGVRRIFVGNYEIRYEIQITTISVLRLWHAREDR